MTLLMTGGADLLGLHLIQEKLLAGRHVTVFAHDGVRATYDRIEHFLTASRAIHRLPAPRRELLAAVPVDPTHHTLGLSAGQQRALAARATELWHVAVSAAPTGRDAAAWHSSVSGTENLLRFASCLPATAPLRHVSTAFVGGRTREGVFRERHSAEVTEFENTYERTNHTVEGLVRRWANRSRRTALIIRPSVLIPDPLPAGALPDHPLRTVSRICARTVSHAARRRSRLALRLFADSRAVLNLVQASWAARAMLLLGERITDLGTHAVHLVHPRDTPVRTIMRAIEDVLPMRLRMTPDEPAQPTDAERACYRRGAGFLPYLHHRRRFDNATLRGFDLDIEPPPVIERSHLRDIIATSLSDRSMTRAELDTPVAA